MKKLLLLLAASCAAAFAGNTCSMTLGTRTLMSTTVASDWTNCGGLKPQAGDNIVISGSGTFTLDTSQTYGSGQNPYKGYLASITGSAGGSTACAATPAIGGSAYRSGSIGCRVVSGACAPYIQDRGFYNSVPAGNTTTISTICSGGTPSFTLNWNPGGGAPAILVSNTVKLVISANITAKGDVLYVDAYGNLADAIVIKGGALTIDTTSSSATTPVYSIGAQGNGGTWMRGIVGDATCTQSTCKILGNSGAWRIDGLGSTNGGRVDFENMTLSNWGDVNTIAYVTTGGTTTGNGFTLVNNVIQNSSSYYFTLGISNGVGTIIKVDGNYFQGSRPCTVYGALFLMGTSSSPAWDGTGAREFIANSFDVNPFNATNVGGFTFSGNYWPGQGFVFGRSSVNMAWTGFSNNMMVANFPNDNTWTDAPGGMDHSIFWRLDQDVNNWHVGPGGIAATSGSSYTYDIWGASGKWSGDSGEILIQGGGSSVVNTFSNNIILPGSDGLSFAEPAGSPHGSTNKHVLDHNFWFADYGLNNPAFGFYDLGEVNQTPAATINSMRCNVFDNPSHANSYMLIQTVGSYSTPTTNPGSPAVVDYNWGRGRGDSNSNCPLCTGQGNGYSALWSGGSPGSNDQALDPGYDIKRRRIETFATYYLNYSPTKGAWSSSSDYVLGDTVSDSQAGVYFGFTTAWTCLNAGGCVHGTATRPGTGIGMSNYWEPYTLTWARAQVGLHATISDGSLVVKGVGEDDTACSASNPCDPITAIRHWIYAGAVSSNPQYWNACFDGSTIGPIKSQSATRIPLGISVN